MLSMAALCPQLASQQQLIATASLFERVAEQLAQRYLDRAFCRQQLPALVERYRSAAVAARGGAGERAVVRSMLAEIPASHLALLSRRTRRWLDAEILGQRTPMLGCSLVCIDGRFFVDSVYAGGPAAQAGLRRGEEVVAIGGQEPGCSALLGWRSDDAYLPDPPSHEFEVADGQVVELRLAGPDRARTVRLVARPWSALRASIDGVRALPLGGRRALYVRLWFVYHGGAARLLQAALHDHADCQGLLLDLRGRGGSALECEAVLRVLQRARSRGRSIVALIDGRTRSAKEVLALELRRRGLAQLVGEQTAGAVLVAGFAPVADDAVLMLPQGRISHSRHLEGCGVAPDLAVADRFPLAPGSDPILWTGLQTLEAILTGSPATGMR